MGAEKLACLLEDSDWQVPTAAATALQRIGGASAYHCAAVLSRCHVTAQDAAAEALVRVGGVEAADAAAGLFNDEEPSVRKHAAEVLGLLGQEAAAAHADRLLELCSDSDRDVRMAARTARGKLGLRVDLPPVVGNGDALPDFATIRKGGGKADGKGGSKFEAGKSRSHELGVRQSQSGGRIDRHIA